jgi:hypothetical protein
MGGQPVGGGNATPEINRGVIVVLRIKKWPVLPLARFDCFSHPSKWHFYAKFYKDKLPIIG